MYLKEKDGKWICAAYWIAVVIFSAVNLSVVYCVLFAGGAMSLMSRTISAVADSLLLFMPMIFLRGKWIRVIPVWFVLLALLGLANVLYFRNFNDCISGISYFSAAGFNRFAFDGALGSLRPSDAVFGITSLAVVILTRRLSSDYAGLSIRMRGLYAAVSVVFISAQFALSVRRISIFNSTDAKGALREYADSFRLRTTWKSYVMDYGFSGYLVRSVAETCGGGYTLTDADRRELMTFLDRDVGVLSSDLRSAFAGNRGKNLILIIVESLNSKALFLPESGMTAPCLAGLCSDSSVLFYPRVEAQTGHGRSSDGQFIYNTGMLPLRGEALVSRFADACYPSLAKSLGYESVEVIGEDRSLWSHALTSRSYGFDMLVDNVVAPDVPVALQDSLIFKRAAEIADTFSAPFFMQVTTIGMHKPYNRPTGVSLPFTSIADERDRHYMEAVNAFDRAFASFLTHLKENGIYDRSVIVVAADHEEMYPLLSERFSEKEIPVFILNCGVGRGDVEATGGCCQADLYPTVLDVMGVECRYRGFGRSFLRAGSDRIPYDKAIGLSEKLIRSRSSGLLLGSDVEVY